MRQSDRDFTHRHTRLLTDDLETVTDGKRKPKERKKKEEENLPFEDAIEKAFEKKKLKYAELVVEATGLKLASEDRVNTLFG